MLTKTVSDIDIEYYLKKKKNLIDQHLKKIFQESNNFVQPQALWDALRYSLLDGGKRIRGILCLSTHESFDLPPLEDCLTVACSIELIHGMSLIHDDLPCMDNDDLRRGKPSCHKAFGEATAVLLGDAMLSLAFQLITEYTKEISKEQKLELINALAKAFSLSLVPGQLLDLALCGQKSDFENIDKMSKLKTAELVKTSILCGATVAFGETSYRLKQELKSLPKEKLIECLSSFGLKVGTAFQIIDDILDVASDTKSTERSSHDKKEQEKPTYVSVIGMENSKKLATNLISQAKSLLADLPIKTSFLCSIADYVVNRTY